MKSAIALSMHKAGSSISDRIFTEFFAARGYQIDRISQQVSRSPLPEVEVYVRYQQKMQPEGVYYGMIRPMEAHNMEVIPSLRTIIQVRDPRDCITSAFFSYRESHVPPKDPEKRRIFDEKRAELLQMTIDHYALKHAKSYLHRTRKLERIAASHRDCLLLTYEEMVENTPAWLARVSEFIDQPITDDLRQALKPHTDFSVESEVTSRHKRQVTPGDHRRKLQPETIARMNEILEPGLAAFGYAV